MNLDDAAPRPAPQRGLLPIAIAIGRVVLVSLKRRLLYALVAGAAAWVLHTYLLVVENEGFAPGGSVLLNSVLCLKGKVISGAMFWTLATALVPALVGAMRSDGGLLRYASQAFGIVRQVLSVFQNGPRNLVLVLGGVAATGVASALWGNALVNLMLAVTVINGLMSMKPTGILCTLAGAAHVDLWSVLGRGRPSSTLSLQQVRLIFQGVAFALGLLAVPWVAEQGLILGGVAIVAAVLLRMRGRATPAAAALVAAAAASIAWRCLPAVLFADDGGWVEAGGTFQQWWAKEGSGLAITMGLPAGIGGVAGPILQKVFEALNKGLDVDVIVEGLKKGKSVTEVIQENPPETGGGPTRDGVTPPVDGPQPVEETKPGDYWVSLHASRGAIEIGGNDTVFLTASVGSSLANPDVSPGTLRQRVTIAAHDDGAAWVDLVETGPGTATLTARPPTDEVDPDRTYYASIVASVETPLGPRGDMVRLALSVAVDGRLELATGGPDALTADGVSESWVYGRVVTTQGLASVEAEALASVAFASRSDWLTLGAPETEAEYRGVPVTAYPPGGDFSKAVPKEAVIEVTARLRGKTLTETYALSLLPMAKGIRTQAEKDCLRTYGEPDGTYIHAWVEVTDAGRTETLDDMTAALGLECRDAHADWILLGPSDICEDGTKAFWIEGVDPSDDLDQDPPSRVTLTVTGTIDGEPREANVTIALQPLSAATVELDVEPDSIRSNGQDTAVVSARVVLSPPDPTQDLARLTSALELLTDADSSDWFAVAGPSLNAKGFQCWEMTAASPNPGTAAAPPARATVTVQGLVYGKRSVESSADLQLFPLSMPSIEADLSQPKLRADGEDALWLSARVTLDPPDAKEDLGKITQALAAEAAGSAAEWLSIGAGEVDGDRLRWPLAAQAPGGSGTARVPAESAVRIRGTFYGRDFERVVPVPLCLPTARIETALSREVHQEYAAGAVVPDGKDCVRLSAWIAFDDDVEGLDLQALQRTIRFESDDGGATSTIFDHERVDETGGTWVKSADVRVSLTATAAAGPAVPDRLRLVVRGEYAGADVTGEATLELLPLPVLVVDPQDVTVLAGGREGTPVVVEVKNPGPERWTFTTEVTGEAPAAVEIEFDDTDDSRTTVVVKGAPFEGRTRLRAENSLKVKATRPGDATPLAANVTVVVGTQGLQVLSETPLAIRLDAQTDAELHVAVRVFDLKSRRVVADDPETLQGLIFDEPECRDARGTNVLAVAQPKLRFLEIRGSGDGAFAVYAARSLEPIPSVDVADSAYDGHVTVRAGQFGTTETPEFSRTIPVTLTTIADIPGSQSWIEEKERCRLVIDKYAPPERYSELMRLLDEQGATLGREGLYRIRHEIWNEAAAAIVKQGQSWEHVAELNDRAVWILEWWEYAGDIAFQSAAAVLLSPAGAAAVGFLAPMLKSAIRAYQEGQTPQKWVWDQLEGLKSLPIQMLVDPEKLAKQYGTARAYALFIAYQFAVEIGTSDPRKSVYDAAKSAVATGIRTLAENRVQDWLQEHAFDSISGTTNRNLRDEFAKAGAFDPTEWGVNERDWKGIRMVADKHGVIIRLRPSNPDSLRLLEQGYPPKPHAILAKTINELDTYLGCKASDKGKVAFFDPGTKPVRPDGMSDDLWKKVEDRFTQREKEFKDLKDSMDKLTAAGDIKIENGVIINTGVCKGADGKPTKTGLPIVGDCDVYDIRSHDGKRVSQPVKDAIIRDMKGFNVEHGAVEDWKMEDDFSQSGYDNLKNAHMQGGQALTDVTPSETIPTDQRIPGKSYYDDKDHQPLTEADKLFIDAKKNLGPQGPGH